MSHTIVFVITTIKQMAIAMFHHEPVVWCGADL
jgi:hypothetical protein